MISAPPLSVILVSWNTRDLLRNCVASILRQRGADRYEVIVVDNSSTDGSATLLRADYPAVRVLTNTTNVGFARACNQGMRAASAPILLLLNSDTYVVDDVIERMLDFLLSRSAIAMAGCQLRYPNGRLQHTAGRSLSIVRSLCEDLWIHRLFTPEFRSQYLLDGYFEHDQETEVDWLAGAFLMLRREAFEASGGFDETFFLYGEDSEWGMRLRRHGYRLVFTPLGAVYHVGSASAELLLDEKSKLRRCHLGGIEAYARLNGRVLSRAYALARLVGAAARWCAYVLGAPLLPAEYCAQRRRLASWLMGFYLEGLIRTWPSHELAN